jgi:hypothetical protein
MFQRDWVLPLTDRANVRLPLNHEVEKERNRNEPKERQKA